MSAFRCFSSGASTGARRLVSDRSDLIRCKSATSGLSAACAGHRHNPVDGCHNPVGHPHNLVGHRNNFVTGRHNPVERPHLSGGRRHSCIGLPDIPVGDRHNAGGLHQHPGGAGHNPGAHRHNFCSFRHNSGGPCHNFFITGHNPAGRPHTRRNLRKGPCSDRAIPSGRRGGVFEAPHSTKNQTNNRSCRKHTSFRMTTKGNAAG